MANTTETKILTAAGKSLLADVNAQEVPFKLDKFIFANIPNRADFPQPDDEIPTEHVVFEKSVETRGKLSADVVIYTTTLESSDGPFEFNWTGGYSSEHGVLVTIDHHALTPKTPNEPGIVGNTLVRNITLEYKDVAEITNITVDAKSWQYNASDRMKKMDTDTAQAIIDQNGKDWFIADGFLVTPQSSAFNIKAGAGYVSGNRVTLEFDRNVQVSNKPSFIYVDAHREGTPTGEQVTLFDFVVTAEEKDDYTDANGMKHFVCKIAQVLADGSVSDLRPEGESAGKEWVSGKLDIWSNSENLKFKFNPLSPEQIIHSLFRSFVRVDYFITEEMNENKDHSEAIRTAVATGAKRIIFPPMELFYDGKKIAAGSDVVVDGWGCKITAIPGHYKESYFFIGNDFGVNYDPNFERDENFTVIGMEFNGNADNISFDDDCGMSAFYFYCCDNINVQAVNVHDIPKSNVGLYPGILYRFCKDATTLNCITLRTDRQGVLYLESTGEISGGTYRDSYHREPILVTSETLSEIGATPVYQASDVKVLGVTAENYNTQYGTRVIRFSGVSNGHVGNGTIMRGAKRNGFGSDIEGLFIAYPNDIPIIDRTHTVKIDGVEIEDVTRDIRIQNKGFKRVTINNVTSKNVTHALKSVEGYLDGYLSINNYVAHVEDETLVITDCHSLEIDNVKTYGGKQHWLIQRYGKLDIDNFNIEDNQASDYVMLVIDQVDGEGINVFEDIPLIANGRGKNNINNRIRVDGTGPLGEKHCYYCTNNQFVSFEGARIPVTRQGFHYFWVDDDGIYRKKSGVPKAINDGSAV
ncbi:phage tail protein [Photobacterium lipolyticum]|uniref:Phage tail fibre protein N-terminal domain-containing protein n=1 Tax=Photobacterium lipolyticum TaxID=266810 RepID=A0A2T3N093_9GAMM|nr:phage tail protein [Photobacterium lipolyticum]PSW05630.1 hypothetical protein C9I89_07725 [Photobacterium lipolyticum]